MLIRLFRIRTEPGEVEYLLGVVLEKSRGHLDNS